MLCCDVVEGGKGKKGSEEVVEEDVCMCRVSVSEGRGIYLSVRAEGSMMVPPSQHKKIIRIKTLIHPSLI